MIGALTASLTEDTYKIVLITVPSAFILAILLNSAQKKLLSGVTFLKTKQLINYTLLTVAVCGIIALTSVKIDQLIGILLDKVLNLMS